MSNNDKVKILLGPDGEEIHVGAAEYEAAIKDYGGDVSMARQGLVGKYSSQNRKQ